MKEFNDEDGLTLGYVLGAVVTFIAMIIYSPNCGAVEWKTASEPLRWVMVEYKSPDDMVTMKETGFGVMYPTRELCMKAHSNWVNSFIGSTGKELGRQFMCHPFLSTRSFLGDINRY